jgi:Flp pilus assembly protein TadD
MSEQKLVSRIFPFVLILLSAWLGARLPLTDSGYVDLSQGRQVAEARRLTPPDTILLPASPSDTSGWVGSWLLFLIHRVGGERGLQALGALCLAVGTLLLYLVRPRGAGFVAAAAAASLAGRTLDLSISLFSWPLVTSMVFCWRTLRPKSKWWLLLLLVSLGVWPFLNRESMVGFAVAAVALCTSLAQAIRGARRQEPAAERFGVFQEPLLLGAVGAAAVMLALLTSPDQQLLVNPIREAFLLREAGSPGWQTASLGEDTLFFSVATVTGLLALTAPPLVMPLEALATAGLLLLSLASRHFVTFFAAVAVPPAGDALAKLAGSATSSPRWSLRLLGGRWTALLVGVAAVLPTAIAAPLPHPFTAAAAYLSEHRLDERLFNLPGSGGVTSWTGGPERLSFAYSRAGSIEAFQRETTGRRLAEILADHDLDLALVSRDFANQHADELGELRGLRLLYFDKVALLYAHSEASGDSDELTFRYFDPLLSPEKYAEETVPLVIQELFLYFDRYPPSATSLWKLGKLLLRDGRREEALEAFEAAHRLDVDDPAILRELSRIYIEKGMYGLAERSARRALRLTRDEELVYNLALSLYGQARYAEAAREFEAVVELNDENLKARRALVDIYRELGELEQSYVQKQTLDAMVETETAALLGMARERHAVLDFAEEAALYEQALEVSRDDPDLLWSLAMVLLTDERVPEALNVLRELLAVAPRNAEARLTLGVLCIQEPSCSPDEARIHLEAFFEIAPGDLNAELAAQYLERLE